MFAIDPTDFYFYMSPRLIGICIMVLSASIIGGLIGRKHYLSGQGGERSYAPLSLFQQMTVCVFMVVYTMGGVHYVSAVPAMTMMASLIYTLSGIVGIIAVAAIAWLVTGAYYRLKNLFKQFRSRGTTRRSHLRVVRPNEKGGREDIAG